jgi:NADPH-dependent 2,4-dienoyl-CoA reductase/sulfur reductase-like enzyme/rhodanese-related sulfurtransferase
MEVLQKRFKLDIRVRHEVTAVHREDKCVTAKNLDTGETFRESYDELVLSPGAAPIRPPIPGADRDPVFVLNDLGDMDALHAAAQKAKHAVIVGAGFIGLEMAENLRALGLEVAVVEMVDQVMPVLDREMARPLLAELETNGVEVLLEETVTAIEDGRVSLKSGRTLPSDLVCLSVGVRPTSGLAREAGLELGSQGHIRVDEQMRTSDPAIFAVGDAVEVRDWLSRDPAAVALAGPANRQGRIAADRICGRDSAYRGILGTAIVKVFHMAAGNTGYSEKRLKALGRAYRRVYVHPNQHPAYYPDAKPLAVKVLFDPEGTLLGAQVVGEEGVKAVIDTLATAIQGRLKVQDLEHLELAYSPQWGGAKDPVNIAGFVASNVLRGDLELVEADEPSNGAFWLDVRNKDELEIGMIPGATHIPLEELRSCLDELPKDRVIAAYCAVGLRGYLAYRILKQKGFAVRSLDGGYRTWALYHSNSHG